MNQKKVFFNDALKAIGNILSHNPPSEGIKPLIIRDIYGRIRVALDEEGEKVRGYEENLAKEWGKLGQYGEYQGKKILSREDFFDSESIFKSPDILVYQAPDLEYEIQFLDRQITGQDWTRSISSESVPSPRLPRLVFYGLKGGVGRSTAMAILAYHLAKKGKNVLLVDFDLESPGLSSLMLPADRMAEFGIVDWFVEDAVGQKDEILPRMISISPLSQADGVTGRINVAAAMGMDESSYLPKLSRVYADIPRGEGIVERFHERAIRLVKDLEEREKPDAVLIDSRAGLHDLAAVSIVGLATRVLLFAVDSVQTWQGYRLLFSHWQAYPAILTKVRERLAIIDSLFPESNQEVRAKSFLEHAYKLFSSTIYDEIAPGSDRPNSDIFNFDMGDHEAPHYPLRIKWNARFQEFTAELLSQGIFTSDDISSAYGDFLTGVESFFESEQK